MTTLLGLLACEATIAVVTLALCVTEPCDHRMFAHIDNRTGRIYERVPVRRKVPTVRRVAVLLLTLTAAVFVPGASPATPGCARPATSAAAMNSAVVQGIDYSDSFRTDVLPDGRWMSVTGDTALTGQVYPASNSVVIWDRAGQRRTSSSGNFFPSFPDGSGFWPGQWVASGSTVYVVGSRQKITGPFAWTTLGAYIAVMTVPRCGTPTFVRYLNTPSSGLGDEAVQWSGGLARDGGWYYLHGVLDRPDILHIRDGGYVARSRDLVSWQFWTGTRWGTSAVSTIPAVPGGCGGTEAAYTVHKSELWTVTTKCNGALGDTLGTWTSTGPVGPWTWTPLLTVCVFNCYLTGAALIPTISGHPMVQWSRTNAMPRWAEL